ncbi:IclR family transcriptional regulator domain-containing protein [Oceanobacillus sp. CAU 1775]
MAQNQVSTLRKGLLVLKLVKNSQRITLTELTKYFFNRHILQTVSDKTSGNGWVSLHSLYQIAQDIQMSTYLGKIDDTDLVMTQVLHAPFKESAKDEIGNRSKVHLSALGKVILAHLNKKNLNMLLERRLCFPCQKEISTKFKSYSLLCN